MFDHFMYLMRSVFSVFVVAHLLGGGCLTISCVCCDLFFSVFVVAHLLGRGGERYI